MTEVTNEKLSAAQAFDRQKEIENQMLALNQLIDEDGYNQAEVAKRYFEIYGPEGLDAETAETQKNFLALLPENIVLADGQTLALKDCTVADLGSGPGVLSAQIVNRVKKVIPVDAAPEMIKFIENHPEIFPTNVVEPKVGDFNDGLPLPDESVEIVIASGVVPEILPDQEDRFLSEIMRILKVGGQAVLDSIYYIKDYPEIKKYLQTQRQFFERDRQADIARIKTSKRQNPQRDKIFLDTELPERFATIGYEVDVNPITVNPKTGKDFEKGYINVIITKKSNKKNEIKIN